MTDLHYQSLAQVCRQLKSGALTSVAVTQAMLERINALDPSLHSFVMVLADDALAQAEALDKAHAAGEPLGALHGVPIAIKDLLFTKGIATASGTKVMENFVPDYSATVVDKLRAAGAVIIGKTQLTEGAFGAHHPAIDPPKNPWNVGHWPGVSSSGSGVSVAAGLAFGALGTDTGGSIRFPSASCGLVGIKPTYGRVSRYGAFELAASLDHIGPMTRTVEDAARMLSVIAGQDVNDATTLDDAVPNYGAIEAGSLVGTVVGIDWAYARNGVDAPVVAAIEQSCQRLEGLGASIKEVMLPADYARLVADWGITCSVECARAHADYYPAKREMYGPVLATLIELGHTVTDEAYNEIEEVRNRFRASFDELLTDIDMFISPCMTSLPPTVEAMEVAIANDDERADFVTFTAPFDYSGHPTITLPAGVSDEGLPASIQLVGRHLGESELIRVGLAHEKALWEATGGPQHPPV